MHMTCNQCVHFQHTRTCNIIQNVSGRENVSDLDDMDASLFGNFSHSQNKRAVGRSNTQSSSHGAGKKELSDHRSFMGNTGSVTESQMNIKDTDGTKKSTVTVKNVPEKHTATGKTVYTCICGEKVQSL